MKRAEPNEVQIELPRLNVDHMEVTLIGDSPLISHKWSTKAKQEMLDKQMKKAKQAKTAKEPFLDFAESLYWLTPMPAKPDAKDIAKAQFGFPAVAFKAAAVDACSHISNITKVEARGSFHIIGDMVTIEGDKPVMREDMVRIGMGTADIRHRGEFKQWRTKFVVRYNKNVISPEQILNLFNTAGFAVGVGEWRPQKDGSFGMFHVATQGE